MTDSGLADNALNSRLPRHFADGRNEGKARGVGILIAKFIISPTVSLRCRYDSRCVYVRLCTLHTSASLGS